MTITLTTLPNATAQQVFNQVATHLLTQNARAENENGCQYHAGNGQMCAAGCLISRTEFDESFEECDWVTLVNAKMVPSDHSGLIQDLQSVHDTHGVHAWKDRLAHVAAEHGLEFTP